MDPQLNSGEHTRLACLFRRLAETDATAECERKFTNTRGACAPYNLRPTRPPLQQYEEKLPGTWGRPAAHFILVRFYGFRPLRSGWAALPYYLAWNFTFSY